MHQWPSQSIVNTILIILNLKMVGSKNLPVWPFYACCQVVFFLMVPLCTQNSLQFIIRLFRFSPRGVGGAGDWRNPLSGTLYEKNWLVAACHYFIICFIYYEKLVKNLSKIKNKWQQRYSNLESLWICHLNFTYHTCFKQGIPWHSYTLKRIPDIIITDMQSRLRTIFLIFSQKC